MYGLSPKFYSFFFFKFLHSIVEDKGLKHSRGITQNTALIISVSPLNGVSYLEYPELLASFSWKLNLSTLSLNLFPSLKRRRKLATELFVN